MSRAEKCLHRLFRQMDMLGGDFHRHLQPLRFPGSTLSADTGLSQDISHNIPNILFAEIIHVASPPP